MRYIKKISLIGGFWLFALTAITSAAPLTIEQAVDMALTNHLDIKIAANEEKEALYSLQSAKGSKGVSLTASNNTYLKKPGSSADASTSSMTLSLPLYSGGKNEGNIKIAQNDVTKAGVNSVKTKLDVKSNTITDYLNVIKTHQAQAVAQETVDNYQLHLNNVKEQYSVDNVAKSDVLRSEVELADAQQTLLQAQNSYAVAVNTLKKQLRWKEAGELELVEEFQYVPFTMSMEDSVVYAKAHSPELEKYRLAIQSAEQSVVVAKADNKPTVSLTSGVGWSDASIGENSEDTYVGLTTSWNLFDSQVTKSKVKKAKSAVDTTRLELDAQEDAVELAAKEYYLNMKEAEKRRDTTQLAISKAKEDYSIAAAKYRVGEGVILDIIDAQLALTTAQNNDIEAQYAYADYKAKLENVMGMN